MPIFETGIIAQIQSLPVCVIKKKKKLAQPQIYTTTPHLHFTRGNQAFPAAQDVRLAARRVFSIL